MSDHARRPLQRITRPLVRKLRVFAVDPGLTARSETAITNEMTLAIPWEDLQPGPAGEYLEVIDVDEHGKRLNEPVDLDHPDLLAQDGLSPSDGNPHFRQQMVYAVGMRTVRNFERALGRSVHWVSRPYETADDGEERSSLQGAAAARPTKPTYLRRLRLHPHFSPMMNAYYSPVGRFCFGYFESPDESELPGTLVFTCLSQDVIAHELVHAVLLGMGVEFGDENPDVAAFHEAFADLVPLFQHFWKSDVLAAQIGAIRGKLDLRSTLGAVALQFGKALGKPDGLRNALGQTKDGVWQPRRPEPARYKDEREPHERGDILVGAVFLAFQKIFESRVADLRRIATKGTGILPDGTLHPDLINRFTDEASKSARHLLDMCVRALDYLPPANLTFGDYLRAIITADYDLFPIDERHYRVAFVDAFRSYGIVPADIRTLSIDTLLWTEPANVEEAGALAGFFQNLACEEGYWRLPREREELWRRLEMWKDDLARFLAENATKLPRHWSVIDFAKPFAVSSFLPRERAGVSGRLSSQWVIKITQEARRRSKSAPNRPAPMRGLTLLVDASTGLIRYRIAKRSSPVKRRPADEFAPKLAQAASQPTRIRPSERKLRVFAFDPTLGVQLETAGINEITLRVPWERDGDGNSALKPGPVGEYLEVIDRDPASECFYAPVDLNHRYILAQDGLSPSESNPQFHQQMVYAVAMRTIQRFERALGRQVLWAPKGGHTYVQRLRLYPHALREANAYYSPGKVAVLFGYFAAPVAYGAAGAARVNVFTCLSHDIIVHEVTHALLDGMHRSFAEASNPDVLAFHEAFADIVALFQHFSLPGVLRHQIAMSRGDLAGQNRLGEVAQQFGQALGKRGALRSAIGEVDEETGKWKLRAPDPADYQQLREPHDRGALLVAAIFDAFLTIYKARVADLLRLASEGTGVLPEGQLHPDLVNRLADEAAWTAGKVLDMCIRALDYCPPVDVTFGDYLRALITADHEFDPIGGEHRRIAVAEAFRRHGIVPEGVRTLSIDGLLWRPTAAAPDENEDVLLAVVSEWPANFDLWGLSHDRRDLFEQTAKQRFALQKYLCEGLAGQKVTLSGIESGLEFEVHSIRPSLRMDWEGRPSFQWIVELTQGIPQFVGSDPKCDKPDYYLRGGCTLVIDGMTGKVRYTIRKTLDDARKARQRRFIMEGASESLAATYFGISAHERNEPFAMLHRY